MPVHLRNSYLLHMWSKAGNGSSSLKLGWGGLTAQIPSKSICNCIVHVAPVAATVRALCTKVAYTRGRSTPHRSTNPECSVYKTVSSHPCLLHPRPPFLPHPSRIYWGPRRASLGLSLFCASISGPFVCFALPRCSLS